MTDPDYGRYTVTVSYYEMLELGRTHECFIDVFNWAGARVEHMTLDHFVCPQRALNLIRTKCRLSLRSMSLSPLISDVHRADYIDIHYEMTCAVFDKRRDAKNV